MYCCVLMVSLDLMACTNANNTVSIKTDSLGKGIQEKAEQVGDSVKEKIERH